MGRLIPLTSAVRIRRRLARLRKKVVLTNGVFDLLHIGHIRYLQQARNLGDVLMVGLNSDVSVRLLKGPARPWVPESERAEVLCALECVDYVVLFSEPTAIDLVSVLRPDVYVKGGDYTHGGTPSSADGKEAGTRSIPEAAAVQSYGGLVVTVDYTADHSSSILAERIRAYLAREDAE